MKPRIQQHPNQEIKNGRAPYASPVKKNFSTNEPLSSDDSKTGRRARKSVFTNAATNRKRRKKWIS